MRRRKHALPTLDWPLLLIPQWQPQPTGMAPCVGWLQSFTARIPSDWEGLYERMPQMFMLSHVSVWRQVIYVPERITFLFDFFFQIYSGKAPFYDLRADSAVLLHVIKGGRPTRPSGPGRTMPEELWNIVKAAWHHQPSKRPDVTEILRRYDHDYLKVPHSGKFLRTAEFGYPTIDLNHKRQEEIMACSWIIFGTTLQVFALCCSPGLLPIFCRKAPDALPCHRSALSSASLFWLA